MLSLTFQLPVEMASAESSPLLMPFDHVKAAVTEFGMIFISFFFPETNNGLVETKSCFGLCF
jgi:hypothetical protein